MHRRRTRLGYNFDPVDKGDGEAITRRLKRQYRVLDTTADEPLASMVRVRECTHCAIE